MMFLEIFFNCLNFTKKLCKSSFLNGRNSKHGFKNSKTMPQRHETWELFRDIIIKQKKGFRNIWNLYSNFI